MGKRYFIELSRKDVGLVSYFPGLEMKDDPNASWIGEVLVPAIESVRKRKSKKIREVPITFWISVRRTARRRAEILLFMTPAYPGALIERALSQALESIKDGKVHTGREPIPEEAFPCLQVFRGKLIRFYSAIDGYEGFYLASIRWEDNAPILGLLPVPGDSELLEIDEPIEQAEKLLAEARILDISNGEECRKFQQALIPVAMQAD
jgi:hypothetical protein